jgi:hypothetical protein
MEDALSAASKSKLTRPEALLALSLTRRREGNDDVGSIGPARIDSGNMLIAAC